MDRVDRSPSSPPQEITQTYSEIHREAFEKAADLIAKVDVPLSKRDDLKHVPGEHPDIPVQWLSDYAAGIAEASDGKLTKEEAMKRYSHRF